MDETILNNLVGELKRGTQVLAVLAHLHRGQYGYSLLQDLSSQGVNIEAGTLYPLLRRLESQGLLKSDWDTSETRPRKYYTLSPDGEATFDALKKQWQMLTDDINAVLKENEHGK